MLGGIAGLIGPRSGRFDSATAQPIRNAPLATFTTFTRPEWWAGWISTDVLRL
jgi:hypothetical protein